MPLAPNWLPGRWLRRRSQGEDESRQQQLAQTTSALLEQRNWAALAPRLHMLWLSGQRNPDIVAQLSTAPWRRLLLGTFASATDASATSASEAPSAAAAAAAAREASVRASLALLSLLSAVDAGYRDALAEKHVVHSLLRVLQAPGSGCQGRLHALSALLHLARDRDHLLFRDVLHGAGAPAVCASMLLQPAVLCDPLLVRRLAQLLLSLVEGDTAYQEALLELGAPEALLPALALYCVSAVLVQPAAASRLPARKRATAAASAASQALMLLVRLLRVLAQNGADARPRLLRLGAVPVLACVLSCQVFSTRPDQADDDDDDDDDDNEGRGNTGQRGGRSAKDASAPAAAPAEAVAPVVDAAPWTRLMGALLLLHSPQLPRRQGAIHACAALASFIDAPTSLSASAAVLGGIGVEGEAASRRGSSSGATQDVGAVPSATPALSGSGGASNAHVRRVVMREAMLALSLLLRDNRQAQADAVACGLVSPCVRLLAGHNVEHVGLASLLVSYLSQHNAGRAAALEAGALVSLTTSLQQLVAVLPDPQQQQQADQQRAGGGGQVSPSGRSDAVRVGKRSSSRTGDQQPVTRMVSVFPPGTLAGPHEAAAALEQKRSQLVGRRLTRALTDACIHGHPASQPAPCLFCAASSVLRAMQLLTGGSRTHKQILMQLCAHCSILDVLEYTCVLAPQPEVAVQAGRMLLALLDGFPDAQDEIRRADGTTTVLALLQFASELSSSPSPQVRTFAPPLQAAAAAVVDFLCAGNSANKLSLREHGVLPYLLQIMATSTEVVLLTMMAAEAAAATSAPNATTAPVASAGKHGDQRKAVAPPQADPAGTNSGGAALGGTAAASVASTSRSALLPDAYVTVAATALQALATFVSSSPAGQSQAMAWGLLPRLAEMIRSEAGAKAVAVNAVRVVGHMVADNAACAEAVLTAGGVVPRMASLVNAQAEADPVLLHTVSWTLCKLMEHGPGATERVVKQGGPSMAARMLQLCSEQPAEALATPQGVHHVGPVAVALQQLANSGLQAQNELVDHGLLRVICRMLKCVQPLLAPPAPGAAGDAAENGGVASSAGAQGGPSQPGSSASASAAASAAQLSPVAMIACEMLRLLHMLAMQSAFAKSAARQEGLLSATLGLLRGQLPPAGAGGGVPALSPAGRMLVCHALYALLALFAGCYPNQDVFAAQDGVELLTVEVLACCVVPCDLAATARHQEVLMHVCHALAFAVHLHVENQSTVRHLGGLGVLADLLHMASGGSGGSSSSRVEAELRELQLVPAVAAACLALGRLAHESQGNCEALLEHPTAVRSLLRLVAFEDGAIATEAATALEMVAVRHAAAPGTRPRVTQGEIITALVQKLLHMRRGDAAGTRGVGVLLDGIVKAAQAAQRTLPEWPASPRPATPELPQRVSGRVPSFPAAAKRPVPITPTRSSATPGRLIMSALPSGSGSSSTAAATAAGQAAPAPSDAEPQLPSSTTSPDSMLPLSSPAREQRFTSGERPSWKLPVAVAAAAPMEQDDDLAAAAAAARGSSASGVLLAEAAAAATTPRSAAAGGAAEPMVHSRSASSANLGVGGGGSGNGAGQLPMSVPSSHNLAAAAAAAGAKVIIVAPPDSPLNDGPIGLMGSRAGPPSAWGAVVAAATPHIVTLSAHIAENGLRPLKLQLAWLLLLLAMRSKDNQDLIAKLQRTAVTPLALQLQNAEKCRQLVAAKLGLRADAAVTAAQQAALVPDLAAISTAAAAAAAATSGGGPLARGQQQQQLPIGLSALPQAQMPAALAIGAAAVLPAAIVAPAPSEANGNGSCDPVQDAAAAQPQPSVALPPAPALAISVAGISTAAYRTAEQPQPSPSSGDRPQANTDDDAHASVRHGDFGADDSRPASEDPAAVCPSLPVSQHADGGAAVGGGVVGGGGYSFTHSGYGGADSYGGVSRATTRALVGGAASSAEATAAVAYGGTGNESGSDDSIDLLQAEVNLMAGGQ